MPSAMNANRMVQSASPDMGSAPGLAGNFALGGQSDVMKQVLCVIDKKVRNMEKKKVKMFDICCTSLVTLNELIAEVPWIKQSPEKISVYLNC